MTPVPAAFHVTVQKPFDQYAAGQPARLSVHGYTKLVDPKNKMTEHIKLDAVEMSDGSKRDAKGKEIEAAGYFQGKASLEEYEREIVRDAHEEVRRRRVKELADRMMKSENTATR